MFNYVSAHLMGLWHISFINLLVVVLCLQVSYSASITIGKQNCCFLHPITFANCRYYMETPAISQIVLPTIFSVTLKCVQIPVKSLVSVLFFLFFY